ncbi:hypothetical protein TNCV_4421751 [Trichonephila clavipes]|nr:hypothetical protein TNCV_4421751 [Trichonephila clavipes]
MDHVILNHGQVTRTTPELAPPLLTTTPTVFVIDQNKSGFLMGSCSRHSSCSQYTVAPTNYHPDKAQKPRLPDPIVQPIVIMPLSRTYNTTFVMPLIEDLS